MSAVLIFSRVVARRVRRACNAAFVKRFYATENINNDCVTSPYSDVDIPRVHFTEFLINNFQKYPDKIAVECAFTNRHYTYGELLQKSENLNKSLRKKLKLQRGDVVATLLPNIPEYIICILGISLAGLVITPISTAYTADEIKRQLIDSDAKVVVTIPELWKNAKTAVDQISSNLEIITIKNKETDSTPAGAIDFHELVNSKLDIPDIELPSPDATFIMPYSSGTTGLPKGVELSSYNIITNFCQTKHPQFQFANSTTDSHQDVTMAILPIFHIYGFTTLFSLMGQGIKVVALPKFSPESFMKSLILFQPHILVLVPLIIFFLSSHPAVKPEFFPALRTVVSAAAPLGHIDEEKLRQKLVKPINIIQAYGLTETSPGLIMTPIERQGQYPGSMGTLFPNTLAKVIDVEDSEAKHLGVNKSGELLVKGPQIMKGYHNKPEDNKNAFLDGWFKTGDMVYYNEDRIFYIDDRIKDLIKVKGFQVPPAELEEIIRNFPGVADVAVIGIPHKLYGEVPRAYVVQKPNNNIDVKKLQEHVESKVAKHKKLEGGIAVINAIPKTPSGKSLKKQLKLDFEKNGV